MEITAASKGKRGACAACGDSPVAHFPTYLAQSFEAWLADRTAREDRGWWQMLNTPAKRLAERIVEDIPRTAHLMGAAHTSRDPAKAASYRSQVIWEEAIRRGIEMEQLTFFNMPTELYRANIDGRWHYFQSLPIPPALERGTFEGLDDKARLKRFLISRGIPASAAHIARTAVEARQIFAGMHKPIVVKPRIGSRARHTTTNIHTLAELDAAFQLAQVLCRDVLLEEHLDGAVSRATVVGGTLRGFLQMFPARVTGDGVHSIAQLVAQKNATRAEGVQAIELDDEHRAYLARSGYAPDTVLEAGKTLDLSRRTGRFEGGATREMPERIHPKLRSYIECAAQELRVPVVGFDVIIPDPEADPDTQRWGILEANSLPYIDLHYAPLEGKPSNVAAAVWDLWNTL